MSFLVRHKHIIVIHIHLCVTIAYFFFALMSWRENTHKTKTGKCKMPMSLKNIYINWFTFTMNLQTPPERSSIPVDRDDTTERLVRHCQNDSPIGRPAFACNRCRSKHIKCVIRRNVNGAIVGCTHCLTSDDYSTVCSLAFPTVFHSYRHLFHQRIPATDDHDGRRICFLHEDPSVTNAFNPPQLSLSMDSHVSMVHHSNDAPHSDMNSAPQSHFNAVDVRSLNGSPDPDKCLYLNLLVQLFGSIGLFTNHIAADMMS